MSRIWPASGRLFKHNDLIYSQFATHNAHSIAAVLELAPANANFEFQRLHGMGRLLYAEAARQVANFPRVRVYAPVGEHKDLLAYLVRRLLENGANTSFVNRFMDDQVPVVEIVRDPISELERLESYAHARLPIPAALYSDRRNSRGIDLGDPRELEALRAEISPHRARDAGESSYRGSDHQMVSCARVKHMPVTNPADRRDQVGSTRDATPEEIKIAFDAAAAAQPAWNSSGGDARATAWKRPRICSSRTAQRFTNSWSVKRERPSRTPSRRCARRSDYCRYYALRARKQFAAPDRLEGPTGEINELMLQGRGVFACISPWNFPLAIFAGQVTAALAAGNAVVAKPAEPTPLIAARFIRLLHEAGVPPQAVHLVPTPGRLFGEIALAHPALAGVAMTGSTATALTINRAMAARGGIIVPLIAETGGMNAMIVDSTALPEQVVDDVVSSAFMSAGQRCSALRLLFLQEEIADAVLEMIAGAMDELLIGDPSNLQTDVGPVINAAARDGLAQHVARMRKEARIVKACELGERPCVRQLLCAASDRA